jgi:hypothetical protein
VYNPSLAAASACTHVRASTINPSQLAIRIKVIFSCLVGGERRGERREVDSHARDMAHWLVASVSRFYILGVSIETDDIGLKDRVITRDGNAFYKRVYRRPNTLCHRRWLALAVLAGSGRSWSRNLDGGRRWSMALRHKGREG